MKSELFLFVFLPFWLLTFVANDQLCLVINTAVVSFGGVTREQKEAAETFGLVIYAWDDFLEQISDYHIKISASLFYSLACGDQPDASGNKILLPEDGANSFFQLVPRVIGLRTLIERQ